MLVEGVQKNDYKEGLTSGWQALYNKFNLYGYLEVVSTVFGVVFQGAPISDLKIFGRYVDEFLFTTTFAFGGKGLFLCYHLVKNLRVVRVFNAKDK
jgi:hypothetical protein